MGALKRIRSLDTEQSDSRFQGETVSLGAGASFAKLLTCVTPANAAPFSDGTSLVEGINCQSGPTLRPRERPVRALQTRLSRIVGLFLTSLQMCERSSRLASPHSPRSSHDTSCSCNTGTLVLPFHKFTTLFGPTLFHLTSNFVLIPSHNPLVLTLPLELLCAFPLPFFTNLGSVHFLKPSSLLMLQHPRLPITACCQMCPCVYVCVWVRCVCVRVPFMCVWVCILDRRQERDKTERADKHEKREERRQK